MYNNLCRSFFISCILLLGAQFFVSGQQNPQFIPGAVKEERVRFYNSMVKGINGNLSVPLNKVNEGAWINAFNALNLVKYNTPFVHAKIDEAVKNMNSRGTDFQTVLIELLNSEYPGKYTKAVKTFLRNAGNNAKLFAMAANYILPYASPADIKFMQQQVMLKLKRDSSNVIYSVLNVRLQTRGKEQPIPSLQTFFAENYLPGQVLVFSFQRQDRNFPGLAMVRNANGRFLKNPDSTYFSVGQLARSESNMPGYISMGNTPQGIFRMDGFDTSKGSFIGPTTNIQLTMPFEFKAAHFYQTANIPDSVWTLSDYAKLLPDNFKNFYPLYGTYYAGKAGRNEIIAHGTTIDPAFYKSKTYYPYSPSAGCLVCKETRNEKGILQDSDQLLLTRAVKTAGGPQGYLIVIEIDQKRSAVSVKDILSYLPD